MKGIKKYPFKKQDGLKDCGVTCLSMIIEYYKGFVNIEKLREMTKTNKNGCNAYYLTQAAKQLGFESYGIKFTLFNNNATNIILPAIAHVVIDKVYGHFVVIYEINYKKKYLIIADPATRLKHISFSEFEKIFTGELLIMYPIKKIISDKKISIPSYIKKTINFKSTITIFILSILTIFITLIYLYFVKQLLNGKINNTVLIGTILIIFIKYILNAIKDELLIKTNLKNYTCIMNDTFSNIISLPYQYYRNRTTGEMISRINDIDNLRDLTRIVILVITDIILSIIASIFLFTINPILFLICFLTALIHIIEYFCSKNKMEEKLEQLKQSKSLTNSLATEIIAGFESVKGQNLENMFLEKLKKQNSIYINDLNQYEKLRNKKLNRRDCISDFSIIFILSMGVILIHKNQLSFNNLILFYTIMSYFLDPFQNITEISAIIQDMKLSLKRVIELKYSQKIEKPKLNGDIIFTSPTFISNTDFKIKQKDKIMMIGKSGSGKSTLLKTLKQYYKAKNIYINTKNLNSVNFKKNITYISQNEYLFTDTLYNNIVMNRNIDDKKLDLIIKICHIDEIFKNNKLGLNMLIEENGFNLSGGERQRIILARSLVNDASHLFIDEGLSEVDVNLERKILKEILKHFNEKTIIVVSHRIDNIDLFDKVIKVDEKIELLEKRGG